MAILTDTKARHIKPGDPPLPHGGITGLTLHSSPTKGLGKWVFRYTSPVTGKRRNAGLGSYPDIGIAQAGKLALPMREQIANGIDPLDARKAESKKEAIPTFEKAARKVHAELLSGWKNEKHGKQWISTLERYIFPQAGKLTLDNMTPSIIAEMLRTIWLSHPETASRVKQRIHNVMQWAWAHGYCTANPVDVVGHLLPQQVSANIRVEHQPAMPWREIPSFIATNVYNEERYNVTRALL